MPLLGLSRNSAVAGNFFRENLSATYSAHYCLALNRVQRKNEKFSGLQIKVIIYVKMISKLYTIILINYEICPFFGDLYNRWVLASQQKALGPCKCARFRVMKTYRNYSFSYFGRPIPPETPDTQATNAHYK